MKINVITAWLGVVVLCASGCSHPSDQSLLTNFERDEQVFEQLIVMIRKDRELRRVDDTWTLPEDQNDSR